MGLSIVSCWKHDCSSDSMIYIHDVTECIGLLVEHVHILLCLICSLPNLTKQIRWSLDLRWQRPDEPAGFYGMKEPLLMRTAKNPNYKIDWKPFDRVDRREKQRESVEDVLPVCLTLQIVTDFNVGTFLAIRNSSGVKPGPTAIKKMNTNFVLILQNCAIRKLYILDATTCICWVRKQNTYSKVV